jgi:carbonic anhydrase/acetyltransferase-like protein (isoleucine patch superfamily)
MQELDRLMNRIIGRAKINWRSLEFDVDPYLKPSIPGRKLSKYYAFYAISSHHPLHLHFSRSNLAGSYFLGKCRIEGSILYKTDIRGDELKLKGEEFQHGGYRMAVDQDEIISISDSLLIKTLVHNRSHDPENPEVFRIKNSVACAYANIHGSPLDGSFLGAFATVDLTTLHGCIVGPFAYVQAGELWHQRIDPGQVWIRQPDAFDFRYRFPKALLSEYIRVDPGQVPQGRFMDFLTGQKKEFRRVFEVIHMDPGPFVPKSSSLSRYAVIKPRSRVGENVLIAQRAYIENSCLEKGSNVQENCFIIDSRLEGNNVAAHGAKLIQVHLKKNVFVGFNSFLRGAPDSQIHVGEGSIVMPHTIIDMKQPVAIAPEHLVWGISTRPQDLRQHCLPLADLAAVRRSKTIGAMEFRGSGEKFVSAFRNRIHHILHANGAYFDGRKNRGHAQRDQKIAFNIIQPYAIGARKGIFPTIDIQP